MVTMSAAFEKWSSAPAPKEAPKKELRKAEFRLIESEENETRLQIGIATEASPDHPMRNEDHYYASEDRGLAIVADGVGGGLAGNLASARATQELTLLKLAKRDPMTRLVMEAGREEKFASDEDAENAVRASLENMQSAITELQRSPEIIALALREAEKKYKRKLDPSNPADRQKVRSIAESMSCTASLSKIWKDMEGKDHITFGNVGDSRIYRLRHGRLERMTPDHSVVQTIINERMVDTNGVPIEDDQDIERKISIAEFEKHAPKDPGLMGLIGSTSGKKEINLEEIRHYVTQTLGVPEDNRYYNGKTLDPYIRTEELADGDIILTCSDGLSNVLTDDEMRAILARHAEHPLEAAKALQTAAAERSKTNHIRAKPDDVTAVVQRYQKKKHVTE